MMNLDDAQKAYPVLEFFTWSHLPKTLQDVSRPFSDLAWETATECPRSPETAVALRKLLEAKDAAVRSMLSAYGGQVDE